MNSSTKIALVITLLDAMGIGIIMPVLPTLLREFIASEDIANHFGVLLALYALMQVIFAPWLGKMSDRFGQLDAVVVINRRIAGLLIAGFPECALDAVFRPFAFRDHRSYWGCRGIGVADTTSASQRVEISSTVG